MTTQSIANARYPICERAQRMQDILLVSSFGLWAMLLGLSPVLAFHALEWRSGVIVVMGGITSVQMQAKSGRLFKAGA